MEQLVLYIDKQYIIGALCTDGVCSPLRLPNGDDRIWLYFHEDTIHNEVTYGKQYEPHCLNRKLHYYGEVFDQICDSRIMFTQYAHPNELRNIFSVSRIFDHIKQPFNQQNNIDSYVSFSRDIGPAARSIFIEELEEAGFSVKIRVARCELLTLESMLRKSQLDLTGETLVLNALGNNLYFSVFRYSDKRFVRMVDDCLPGMGMDMRERALVEDIVEKANWNDAYLKTDGEKEYEHQRLKRLYGTQWMETLKSTRNKMPVSFGNFYFANAQYNVLGVTTQPSDIDKRTKAVVNDIVREVCRPLSKFSIRNIVMIGDTFSNSMFVQALKEKFSINDNNIHIITPTNLFDILGVYPIIDADQFSSVEKKEATDAEAERKRIENAIKEEEEQKNAETERLKEEELEKERTEAEKWYQTEMQSVYEYEVKQEYDKMLAACIQALKHKPGDAEAEKKRDDANRYLAKEEVLSSQYADFITKAKDCFEKSQYQEALILCENALSIRPDSSEASRIKSDSLTALNRASRIRDFVTSANIYLNQKMYKSAEKELKKILNLDPQNEEALQLTAQLNEQKSIIKDLTTQFSKAEKEEDIELLQSMCERMKEYDTDVFSKWSNRIEGVRQSLAQRQQNLKLLSELRSQIDTAMFNEDWQQVVALCTNSLSIEFQKDIDKILQRANVKLEKKAAIQDYQQKLDEIQSLISLGETNDAKTKLRAFQEKYSEKQVVIKRLWGLLFEAEDTLDKLNTKRNNGGQRGDFFGEQGSKDDSVGKQNVKEDFFGEQGSKDNSIDKQNVKEDFFGEQGLKDNSIDKQKVKDDFFGKAEKKDDFF